MKKIISLLAALAVLFVFRSACAEVFAFESFEYDLLVSKTMTIKPVAQGIEGKLTYEWESDDETVATVSDGRVKGVEGGLCTIKCTATTEGGKEYVAEYKLNVLVPVSKITFEETDVTMFRSDYHTPIVKIEPENASNKEIEWSSSNPNVAHVFENGNILSLQTGNATITGKAKDGSGVSAKIKIKIPNLVVTDKEVVVAEKDGYLFGYQFNGGTLSMGISGDAFETEPAENDKNEIRNVEWIKIKPIRAGVGYINFNVNGSRTKIKVTVEHSAVYDTVSYPPADVKDILYDLLSVKDKVFSVQGTVVKQEDRPEYDTTLVYAKQGDDYFVFGTSIKNKKHVAIGTDVIAYGTCEQISTYKTETGLSFKCAVIEAEKISILQ